MAILKVTALLFIDTEADIQEVGNSLFGFENHLSHFLLGDIFESDIESIEVCSDEEISERGFEE
jgi:hypothetical protein